MADISNSFTQEHKCPSCKDHIPNGEKSWMSGGRQSEPSSTMSQFKASADRGCHVCSLIFRSVKAIEPEMISRNTRTQICISDTILIGNVPGLLMPWGIKIYASPEVSDKRWPGMAVGPKQIFSPTLASDDCFAQVNRWINDCVNSHTHLACQQSAMPVLPSRVLDLGLTSSTPDLRLLTTHGLSGSYVTLSHRWGVDQTFLTQKASLLERENSIDFNTLPKTFQDAITVTRRIGVRYLWIDSLCIIQDDAKDWEKESAKMGQIYTNAFLTIAAASASSDLKGFLLRRDLIAGVRLHSLENSPGEPDIIAQKQMIHSSGDRDPDDERIPLWSRAWGLQEDVLSRRLLTYHYDEMTWECNTVTTCECGSGTFDEAEFTGTRVRALIQKALYNSKTSQESQEPGFDPNDSHTELYAMWRDLVIRYTARDLTKRTDTLPALSGIAATIQYSLKDQYIGGIWKGDLKRELLWGVDVRYPSAWFGQLPSNYRAPSFCWASIDCYGIRFPNVDSEFSELDHELEPKILDVQYAPRGNNSLGDLSSGSMKIHALIFKTSFRFEFFRSRESGKGRFFYPDTKLRDVDVKLQSGDMIRTAQRAPKRDESTQMSRKTQYSLEILSAVSGGLLKSAAKDDPHGVPEQLSIFEIAPDDIDKIQIWAMLVCDSSAIEDSKAGKFMGANDQGILRSLLGVHRSFSPFHTYWLLVLGRSPSKPEAFERLGLLALLTRDKGYTEWINKGVLTEIEIV